MAEKLGVYICEGCDIGKSLNVDELVEYAKKSKLANICPVVKKGAVLCSPEGKAEIEADIAAEGLDGVVLCACSPRVKWDIFQFGQAVQVERVNLREQCVWSFKEDANVPGQLPLIAKDYVRMGMMKLSKSRIPAPEVPETFQTIMVLGGGSPASMPHSKPPRSARTWSWSRRPPPWAARPRPCTSPSP